MLQFFLPIIIKTKIFKVKWFSGCVSMRDGQRERERKHCVPLQKTHASCGIPSLAGDSTGCVSACVCSGTTALAACCLLCSVNRYVLGAENGAAPPGCWSRSTVSFLLSQFPVPCMIPWYVTLHFIHTEATKYLIVPIEGKEDWPDFSNC